MQGIFPQATSSLVADRPVAGQDDDWPEASNIDVELAYALASTVPGLWVERLRGESPLERLARRDAAVDILADLLAESAEVNEVAR